MPSDSYNAFIRHVKDIHVTESVAGLLSWDQETYLPPRGAKVRAAQLALIAGEGHEKLTDPSFGKLLEQVEREADPDTVVSTNVREMRRAYDRKIKLPTRLVQEIASATSLARNAWGEARRSAQFGVFAGHLEKLLNLKREVAERIGYETEPYDALMDEYEPATRAADVERVFDELKARLVPIVAAIREAPRQPNAELLRRVCPQAAQAAFAQHIVEAMGFDFAAGRIDLATHPFCSGIASADVRITTRYSERYVPMALFGLMHEAGHGLYEQGLDAAHAFTPMGVHVSLGIHESQSRMWENLVGRSRAFWTHFFPQLQSACTAFADVTLEDWYFAINAVRPSLIRVEADEVTYNLHIMLRFDIERDMIAGRLSVKDVPEAWNETFRQFFGITPPDDAQGCLQDIHWSAGMFGYFPTYALGNLYAAQFFVAAGRATPELETRIGRGELDPLRQWLRAHIHRHGRRYGAAELVERVTGSPLSHEPFIDYVSAKYQPLYGY